MLEGAWYYLASTPAQIVVGMALVIYLCRRGYHRDGGGNIRRQRVASVFALSALSYSFIVLVTSQLIFHGPTIATLIQDGFGNDRIAWLMVGVIFDGALKIWDEFRS